MKPELKQVLVELSKTSYGQALRDYLEIKYADIGDIMKSNSLDDLKGRQFALKLLGEVFGFLHGDNPKLGESQRPRYD